jgi:hypothetical protein
VRAGDALIQAAPIRVARTNVRLQPAAHRIGAAIETKSVHLQLWPVAAVTTLAENRLHVTTKVNVTRRLRTSNRPRRDNANSNERSPHSGDYTRGFSARSSQF